jgi:hypothetical protein
VIISHRHRCAHVDRRNATRLSELRCRVSVTTCSDRFCVPDFGDGIG